MCRHSHQSLADYEQNVRPIHAIFWDKGVKWELPPLPSPVLDANDRNKDIVTCETCSIGTKALPDLLPPKVFSIAKMAAAPSWCHISISSSRIEGEETTHTKEMMVEKVNRGFL